MPRPQTLIFLVEMPLGKRDFERFGIGYLRKCGFQVLIWDLTPLLHPAIARQINVPDLIQDEGICSFQEPGHFLASMASLDASTLFISMLNYQLHTLWIFRELGRCPARVCLHQANVTPVQPPALAPGLWWQRLRKFSWERAKTYFFPRLPYTLFGVRPASHQICGGLRSLLHHNPVDSHTHTLWAHTLDYDLYLSARAQGPVLPDLKRYGVFLDEFLPSHPDYLYNRKQPPYDPETYYRQLRQCFDRVEQTFGFPIVVAAHPRSIYEDPEQCYGQRSLLRNQTVGLVKDADVVLTHASTSVNYAVLFEKPILFMGTRDIRKDTHEYSIQLGITSALQKNPIPIDESDWTLSPDLLDIPRAIYQDYRENFIKRKGSPEKPTWEIVADALSSG